jgi:hypothetical protein
MNYFGAAVPTRTIVFIKCSIAATGSVHRPMCTGDV